MGRLAVRRSHRDAIPGVGGLGDRPHDGRGAGRISAGRAGPVVTRRHHHDDTGGDQEVHGLAQRGLAGGVLVRLPFAAQAHVDPVHAQQARVDVNLRTQIGQGSDNRGRGGDPGALRAAAHDLQAHQLAGRRHAGQLADAVALDVPAVPGFLRVRDQRNGTIGRAAGDDSGHVGAVPALVGQARARNSRRRADWVDQVAEIAVQLTGQTLRRHVTAALPGQLEG